MTSRTDLSVEAQIVERAPRVRAFIGARVRSPSDADDVAQETLLKAFRHHHSLRDRNRLEAWLYRVARRAIIDHYRQRRAPDRLEEIAAAQNDARLAEVTEAVARSALCYLGTLPDDYRIAVHMADYEGVSHAEIAQHFGISITAAKSRVRRGRQRVRALMEDCCRMVCDSRGRVVDYELRRPCVSAECAQK